MDVSPHIETHIYRAQDFKKCIEIANETVPIFKMYQCKHKLLQQVSWLFKPIFR